MNTKLDLLATLLLRVKHQARLELKSRYEVKIQEIWIQRQFRGETKPSIHLFEPSDVLFASETKRRCKSQSETPLLLKSSFLYAKSRQEHKPQREELLLDLPRDVESESAEVA